MPSFCAIPSCVDKYSHSADISFHKFPRKDRALLEKWKAFVVQERGSDWKPSRWTSICSRHFAQTDFKQHCGRRSLKSRAIPSQLNPRDDKEAVFQEIREKTPEKEPEKQFCHLCGCQWEGKENSSGDGNVSEWIAKCFPTISFSTSPISPCWSCFSLLKSFAAFVDMVTRCQSEKLKISQDKLSPEKQVKPVKIKQEVTVKEEVNSHPTIEVREATFDSIPEEIPNQSSEKTFCEQYLDDIFNYDQSDEPENCEILEINDLEKVFIDIAEETSDTEVKIPPKNRIEIISSISVKSELKPENWITDFGAFSIPSDHTYAKSPLETCKMEKLEGIPGEKTVNSTPRINIIKNLLIPHKCDKCQDHFETPAALSDHKMDKHSGKVSKCSVCGEIFENLREYLVHKIKIHRIDGKKASRRVKCRDCGQDFPSKLPHNHHQRFLCERRKGLSFSCSKCPLEFPKLLELRKHILESHPRAPGRYSQESNPKRIHRIREDGRYSCEICGRTFGRTSNLLRHERLHRPQKEWDQRCRNCGDIFDKSHDLRRHVKMSKNCIKSSPLKNLLQFMCSVCGRQFSSQNGLKLHESSHQVRSVKPCICETCGKSFPRANLLWQHKVSHTDIRSFQCKLCPKVFKRSNGLQQHIRGYHLKLKPHECPVCLRKYALKADMKRCRHSWLRIECSRATSSMISADVI
ncbi:zinc finger protein 675 [Phlebotomus papatasi]|uniref:zinc finger protein 675 n=1 Tax=Phlebotomus papatasi TaxID=29031 RepID=UPI002483D0C6|nr:zinc finger protein 675 [Phlebotomus papatasi]